MGCFVTLLILLIFGPVLLGLLAGWAAVVLAVFLPWMLVGSAIAGMTAGIFAGFVLCRRRRPPASRFRA